MIQFTPFPVLETKNLLLRSIAPDDVSDFFAMRSDPRMHEYTDTKPDADMDATRIYLEKMNRGVIENRWIIWAMEHKPTKKVVGSISIWNLNPGDNSGELGYGIIPAYQGQGLMKEALLRAADFGFKVMGLQILFAYTEETNSSSVKLLERCNFTVVDRVLDAGMLNPRDYHMLVFRLEKSLPE